MSSLLEDYNNDLSQKLRSAELAIASLPELSGDARKGKVRSVEYDLRDAETLLAQIDMEVRGLTASSRTTFSRKLKEAKATIKRLKIDLSKAKEGSDRADLFSGSRYDPENPPESDEQRTRLLATTSRLERTSESLRESERTLLETEQIATGVLSDLHSQRQTIERSKEKLTEADSNLGRASRTIRSMGRRVFTDKLVMLFIIFLLIVVIVLIIYLKWVK